MHRQNTERSAERQQSEALRSVPPTPFHPTLKAREMVLAAFRSTKVEHPSGDHSLHVSEKVHGMHQQYLGFQKNLNNLVLLYRTRHQLMDALNENGLYVSC
jgi:hypothetical protein